MNLNNERGITLVEILASVVIAALIGTIAYAILFGSFKNYEKISTETKIRDEADLIMAEMVNGLYTLQLSEVKATEFPKQGTNNYYIETKDGNIGFIDNQVVIKNKELKPQQGITLSSDSKIEEVNEGQYKIYLELLAENGIKLDLESEIGIIDDTDKGGEEK